MTQEMGTLKFFKLAQKVLEKEGKTDEAFNFEQMADWIKSGKRLEREIDKIQRKML